MPGFESFGEYLRALDERGLLTRIQRPVDKDTQLHPLAIWQFRGLDEARRRAFLFENPVAAGGRRFAMPVAAGALGASRAIQAVALGCPPEDLRRRWADALERRVAPVSVADAPVQEVVWDGPFDAPGRGLDALPVPVCAPGLETAPYLSAGCWVTRDPETGRRNVGVYRAELKAPDRLGIFLAVERHLAAHWAKRRRQGKPLEAAVFLGGPPSLFYAAATRLAYGDDELGLAGALDGAPVPMVRCRTVDLEVPARADIVIEGEIPTDRVEPEGPFGELNGFLSPGGYSPFLRVRCITHRRDAAFVTVVSQYAPNECTALMRLQGEAALLRALRRFRAVVDVALADVAGGWTMAVVVVRRSRTAPLDVLEEVSRRARPPVKLAVAVDEDVDPRDLDNVLTAVLLRAQPHRDVAITPGHASFMDYSVAPPEPFRARFRPGDGPAGASSVLLIDATRKWDYPPLALPERRWMEAARALWEAEGLPALAPSGPWHAVSLGDGFAPDPAAVERAERGDWMAEGRRRAERQRGLQNGEGMP